MKPAVLLMLVLAGCSANASLRSRCQDAEVTYAPVQIVIEAAVTNPAITLEKKSKLQELDLKAMHAIRSCEAAADVGDIFAVKLAESTVYSAGQEAKSVAAGAVQ